jgi:hypothetical protein
MTSLVHEIAAVFTTSPYMHVGCDETGTPTSLPGYQPFAAKHNISGASDLFAYYVKFVHSSSLVVTRRHSTSRVVTHFHSFFLEKEA